VRAAVRGEFISVQTLSRACGFEQRSRDDAHLHKRTVRQFSAGVAGRRGGHFFQEGFLNV
jgi:hypothetical protein